MFKQTTMDLLMMIATTFFGMMTFIRPNLDLFTLFPLLLVGGYWIKRIAEDLKNN